MNKLKGLNPSKYRVLHIPNVPGKPFTVECSTLEEAEKISNVLSDYDRFQFEHSIKQDYNNYSCIQKWDTEAGDWFDCEGS